MSPLSYFWRLIVDILLDNLPGIAVEIVRVLDWIFTGPLAGFAYFFLFVGILFLAINTFVDGRGSRA